MYDKSSNQLQKTKRLLGSQMFLSGYLPPIKVEVFTIIMFD